MKIRSTILWLAALVILGMVNYGVFQKEQLRTTGQLLYMELAPVDPRSLIQGDYMRLDYAILRDFSMDMGRAVNQTNSGMPYPGPYSGPRSGQLLIEYEAGTNIATSAELYDEETQGEDFQLADNQLLINFRSDGWQIRIGAENYFFQEGQANLFEEAEYAELRIAPSGGLILVGLLDEELNPLGHE